MNLEQYIPELMTLVLGAFLGWFPNRKKQRVDTKQIEVDVLEKSLQVLHKDVVEPLTARFVLLQEDYGNVLVQLKQLRNAIEKMHNCRYVNECPIRRELQNDKANGLTVEKITTPIVIPRMETKMTVSLDSLVKLPLGASFSRKNDRATATVTRIESGYEITAECDSLTVLVTELKTEITRLNKEKTDFKSDLKVTETTEVNKPTGFQWFQIWVGRILGALLLFGAGWKLFRR